MGLQLIVQNLDLTAISYGALGPVTSLTGGIYGVWNLGGSQTDSVRNFYGSIDATPVGTPTYSADGVTSTNTSYFNFSKIPTGSRTMISVDYVPTTGNLFYWSSFPGGEYLERTSDNRMQFATTSSTWVSVPAPASARFDMHAVSITNNSGTRIYRPRDQATATASYSTSQDKTNPIRTGISTIATATKTSLFAYWDRALTTGEIDTFYNEMKAFLSQARGISI